MNDEQKQRRSEADAELERPFFEHEHTAYHPDDPYTRDSVRNALSGLLKQLATDAGCESLRTRRRLLRRHTDRALAAMA
jgi:hypothetical protein